MTRLGIINVGLCSLAAGIWLAIGISPASWARVDTDYIEQGRNIEMECPPNDDYHPAQVTFHFPRQEWVVRGKEVKPF